MGIEFIETTKRSTKKGWDKAKQRLSIADLFTVRPEKTIRTIQFKPCDGASASATGIYILREAQGTINVFSDNYKIGICENASASMIEEIKEHHGLGIGRFRRESSITGMIELEVGIEAIKSNGESNGND
jgi:hypothetical protein